MKEIFNKIKLEENKIIALVFSLLIVFIPLREVLANVLSSYVKVIPDMTIFLLLIYTLIKKGRKIVISKTEIFLALFIFVAFISTLFINDMGIKVFILECRSMLLYYILYFVVKNWKLKKDDFDLFIKLLQIILIVVSIFAIIEKIFDKEILFPLKWKLAITSENNFPRVYSFFNNPNTFGFYNFLTFVILSININRVSNKMYFLLVALIFSNIWLSASRSTMLIFVFYISMILVKYHKQILNKYKAYKYARILILSLLIVLFTTFSNKCVDLMNIKFNNNGNVIEKEPEVLPPIEETPKPEVLPPVEETPKPEVLPPVEETPKPEVLPPVEETPKPEIRDDITMFSRLLKIFNGEYFKYSKIDGRAYKIAKGFEVLSDHLFLGSGFGSFGDAASLMVTPIEIYESYEIDLDFYADNEYMKNLTETGIVGFVLFMIFIISMFIKYRKDYIKVLTFSCVCMFGLFVNVFEIQIITFMLVVILSMVKKDDSLYV